ncbi:MAG: hypothetical protein V3U49_08415 [Nitrososphaerales archaeon]
MKVLDLYKQLSWARYWTPFLFTYLLFVDTTGVPNTFLPTIITIDGIFLGLGSILFSLSNLQGVSDSDLKKAGSLAQLLSAILYHLVQNLKLLWSWLGIIFPFLFSILLSLRGLLTLGTAYWTFGVAVATLLMLFGIMNLIWIVSFQAFRKSFTKEAMIE